MLTFVNVTYKIAEYSAILKWYSPSDNGTEAMNYTINTQDDNDVIHSETVSKDVLEYLLHLNYSTNYLVTVHAINCKGSGNSTYFTMFEGKYYKINGHGKILKLPSAGCSVPVDPVNGRVRDYESTEEGAEIRVYCFDKLSNNAIFKCLNSSWYPDPAEQDCISPIPASEFTLYTH